MGYTDLFFGGEVGIRTLGTREGSAVFKTAPFGHSGTSPKKRRKGGDSNPRYEHIPVRRFSKPLPSATRPPFQNKKTYLVLFLFIFFIPFAIINI